MADWNALNESIKNNIKPNSKQEITGQVLQDVLLDMTAVQQTAAAETVDATKQISPVVFDDSKNIGRDFPYVFTEDALPRDAGQTNKTGYLLNQIVKNVQAIVHSAEDANKWSFELIYVHRATSGLSGDDNSIGLAARNRITNEYDFQSWRNSQDLLDGNPNAVLTWARPEFTVVFSLNFSAALVGFGLNFSTYYKGKMSLAPTQYHIQAPSILSNKAHLIKNADLLTIATKHTGSKDLIFEFKRCMANELYTFSRVGFANNINVLANANVDKSTVNWVNEATSDNIGPYDVKKSSSATQSFWVGGNHLYNGLKTARTDSVTVRANGLELSETENIYCDSVDIRVVNTIFSPFDIPEGATELTKTLLIETVLYQVAGNSISVQVHQSWKSNCYINSYYGMQSMFKNETAIRTPDGLYSEWTNPNEVTSFTKANYPKFNRIIERNADGIIQSTWLLPKGIGGHEYLYTNSPIFQHSDGKCYHVLMKAWSNSANNRYFWQGIYSWHDPETILLDNAKGLVYPIHTADSHFICIEASSNTFIPLSYSAHSQKRFCPVENRTNNVQVCYINDSTGCNLYINTDYGNAPCVFRVFDKVIGDTIYGASHIHNLGTSRLDAVYISPNLLRAPEPQIFIFHAVDETWNTSGVIYSFAVSNNQCWQVRILGKSLAWRLITGTGDNATIIYGDWQTNLFKFDKTQVADRLTLKLLFGVNNGEISYINLPLATTSGAGIMSAADKQKLANLEARITALEQK